MKFKYRRFAFICQWLFIGVLVLLMNSTGFLMGISDRVIIRTLLGSIGLYFTFVFMYSGEYLNRYVEFYDDYVRFNSFRFKRMKKVLSLNVKFDNFYSIEARTLPLFGLWGIRINAKDIPHPITVSFCFSKHKKLYRTLCAQVKQHNPKVYIDEKLEKYIGDGENE